LCQQQNRLQAKTLDQHHLYQIFLAQLQTKKKILRRMFLSFSSSLRYRHHELTFETENNNENKTPQFAPLLLAGCIEEK
jgi:hypothetical protein